MGHGVRWGRDSQNRLKVKAFHSNDRRAMSGPPPLGPDLTGLCVHDFSVPLSLL